MKITIEVYLLENYSPETARIYQRDLHVFFAYLPEEKAQAAGYKEILAYVDHLRKQNLHPRTINRMLYGVKAWYQWLVKEGIREDHPCRFIKLRDAKNAAIQLQDLFTPAELEKLLERKERYESARLRNQVIMSLLIYQALRLKETVNLQIQDIDLQKASIRIIETPSTEGRTLQLKPEQIMLFYRYIYEVRAIQQKQPTEKLLLNMRGKPISGEEIGYLVETFKNQFPGKNLSAQSIRQSVIANLLKGGKDLRVVQTFAGHKKASTTEKYRQTGLEELKAAVIKYHPLQ